MKKPRFGHRYYAAEHEHYLSIKSYQPCLSRTVQEQLLFNDARPVAPHSSHFQYTVRETFRFIALSGTVNALFNMWGHIMPITVASRGHQKWSQTQCVVLLTIRCA